jgi:hypothetical protein
LTVQVIRIRQQVNRAAGELRIGPVKTRAGKRDLPLIGLAFAALTARQAAQEADRVKLGSAWADTGWYLRPAPAGRSNLAISCDPSRASASNTAFG